MSRLLNPLVRLVTGISLRHSSHPLPYAALTKYLDELNESAELRQPQSETNDLRKQFREDFAPFKQAEWRATLHDEAIIDNTLGDWVRELDRFAT